MLIRALHRFGIPSDVFVVATAGSILGSIAIWARRNDKNPANAERLGIFIGLWAPTFMLIANALQAKEEHVGLASAPMQRASERIEDKAGEMRNKVGAATH